MPNIPAVIQALTEDLPLSDFHRRFRIRDGVTLLYSLNAKASRPSRIVMDRYTIAIFTRLVWENHRMDVPLSSYVATLRDYLLDRLDIDEYGFVHSEIVASSGHKDVEAETMRLLAERFKHEQL